MNSSQKLAFPSSEEIERQVLSIILNNPQQYAIYENIITEEYFFKQEHKNIYNCVRLAYDNYAKTSLSALVQASKDLRQHNTLLVLIKSLRDDFSVIPSTLEENLKYLFEKSVCREVLPSVFRAKIEVSEGNYDTLTENVGAMYEVLNRPIQHIDRQDWDIAFTDWVNEPVKNGLSGVATGLPYLDEHLGGWQNDLIIIAARPGVGKTISAVFHAYHAAMSGVPTLFISTEVDTNRVISRMVSHETNIPYGQINRRDLSENQKERVSFQAKKIKKIPIFIHDYTKTKDVNEITKYVKFMRKTKKIGIVFIDYLQNLGDNETKTDQTQRVTVISQKIKALQSKLNIPIVACAQINRLNETRGDKRPQLSDINHSGQIEQDASVVIGLYREDYYNRDDRSYCEKNEIDYICLKNRDGGTFTKVFGCDTAMNNIYEKTVNGFDAKPHFNPQMRFNERTGEVYDNVF